jgi:hypothetical protein
MPRFFRRKDVLLFLLFVATLHILFTYLVSIRAGRVAATRGLGVVSEVPLDEEGPETTFRDEPLKRSRRAGTYQSILIVLSLPFGPVFQPLHERWAATPFREGKIRADEYTWRANFVGTAGRVLNSIVFSMLVYGIFVFATRQRRRSGT